MRLTSRATLRTDTSYLEPGNTVSRQPMTPGAAPRFAVGRILTVCVGNICRSPIAEYVLRARLDDPRVVVESAGIAAVPGARIDPRAQRVLERHGIDSDSHVARRLERGMLESADLVLTMERSQLDFIRAFSPAATGKTFLLGRWQGEFEIPDPYGKSQESFDRVYRLIDLALRRWCALM